MNPEDNGAAEEESPYVPRISPGPVPVDQLPRYDDNQAKFHDNEDHPAERVRAIPNAVFTTELEAEAQDLPEPIQLVEGLLCDGDLAVLGGQSKSMKSWMAQHLALCVQYGKPFLGLPTRQGNVLYINLELKPHTIRYRNRAIKSAYALPAPTPEQPGITYLNLRHQAANAETLRATISAYLKANPTKTFLLIVIDPFYMLASGMEEKDAGEMTKLLIAIATIALDTGAAIIMPAHFAKGNVSVKEAIDRISGSGVMARNPDAIITLTRLEEEGTFVLEATLRAMVPLPKISLRWTFPSFVRDGSLDPLNLLQPKKPGPKSKCTLAEFMDLLPETGLSRTKWAEAAEKKYHLAPTQGYNMANDALANGLVEEGIKRLLFPTRHTVNNRKR